MPFLDVPGGRLYFETAGAADAPALLLIHAGIANLRMWDPQVDALARAHFVIRFDSRTFGRTETDDVEFTEQADALAVLDHLGVAAATVIGCSRGGSIAIDLTVESPERVLGLVTIGSSPGGFPEGELTADEQRLADGIDAAEAAGDWPLANRLETEIWDFGPERAIDSLDPRFVELAYELNRVNLVHVDERPTRVRLDPPAYERVGAINVPALIIVGDFDLTPVRDASAYLGEQIPGAEPVRFDEAAHIPSVERPEEFEALLLGWLHRHGL